MIFNTENKKSYVLGYDLGDDVSQISFLAQGSDDPETLSTLTGAELYNIPTFLCKRSGVGQWFFGKEAKRRVQNGEAVGIGNLLTLARSGEVVIIDGDEYDPVSLLTLFIKRSLSLLSMEMSIASIQAIVFTVEGLDSQLIDILAGVTSKLGLETEHIYFQSYEESLYYYMLYQKKDMAMRDVIAIDYNFGDMNLYELRNNIATKPVVTTVKRHIHRELALSSSLPGDEANRSKLYNEIDKELLDIIKTYSTPSKPGVYYLLGEGFRERWAKDTLSYICEGARVFQGDNLFSKGASIAAREKLDPGEASSKKVLLGEDKLKSNLGIMVMKHGEEAYRPLLDAGINWYEAAVSVDVILDEGNTVEIIKTPLSGDGSEKIEVLLDGIANRPRRTTRLRITLEMTDSEYVVLTVEDRGFGDLYHGGKMTWSRTIAV